jgi:regulatory protein
MSSEERTYKPALAYAMGLCSKQERCRSEIREKLESRRLSTAQIGRILDTLEKENYLDEARYAGTFARDKLRFNKWGKVKIRHMLERKQIPGSVIDHALGSIDHDGYKGILREELRKKRMTIKGSNAFDLRGKLFRFAQQRGFESGLIYELLDEIL